MTDSDSFSHPLPPPGFKVQAAITNLLYHSNNLTSLPALFNLFSTQEPRGFLLVCLTKHYTLSSCSHLLWLLFVLLHPPCPPCSSLHMLGTLQSQFCICCFLHLECFSTDSCMVGSLISSKFLFKCHLSESWSDSSPQLQSSGTFHFPFPLLPATAFITYHIFHISLGGLLPPSL